jgi:hypothetical protein
VAVRVRVPCRAAETARRLEDGCRLNENKITIIYSTLTRNGVGVVGRSKSSSSSRGSPPDSHHDPSSSRNSLSRGKMWITLADMHEWRRSFSVCLRGKRETAVEKVQHEYQKRSCQLYYSPKWMTNWLPLSIHFSCAKRWRSVARKRSVASSSSATGVSRI